MGEHLRARFKAPGPKRILCLDGGGSRGVLTCGFLAELESHLRARSGDPGFRLCDYFDLMSGTSTGSIIAAGLALGMSVDEITMLYFDLCPKLFTGRIGPLPYSNAPLKRALHAAFGNKTLGTRALRTGLAIHMKRIDSGSPWIVVNNPDWVYAQDRQNDRGEVESEGNLGFYLKDLTLASAAAPTYFQEAKLVLAMEEKRAKKTGYFIDGGASPNNNPAMQTLLTVTDPAFGFRWPVGQCALMMASIGTGYVRLRFDNENPALHSSAKGIKRYESLSDLTKLKAVISGYNHDISLQQVAMLQALSQPRLPWYINSESELQLGAPFLAPAASLDFQRLDVRLEACDRAYRRPEHIEALVGDLSVAQLDRLRKLDIRDRGLMDLLYRAGEALAKAQLEHRSSRTDARVFAPVLAPDWPAPAFDPPGWAARAAPSPAA